jgi:hypothetical protein
MPASPDAAIMTKPEPPASGPAGAEPEPRDFIADNLRRLFGAVESEELPDRFRDLLRRLADEEGRK